MQKPATFKIGNIRSWTFRHRVAETDMVEGFGQWSTLYRFMTAFVMVAAETIFFIRPTTGFVKENVHSSFNKCPWTQIYAETRKKFRKAVNLAWS